MTKNSLNFFNLGKPRHLLCIFDTRHPQSMALHINNHGIFLHFSIVFIAGYLSQRLGVLGRNPPLLVTVHLRMQLMQTTVSSTSVIEASYGVSKFENSLKMYKLIVGLSPSTLLVFLNVVQLELSIPRLMCQSRNCYLATT